MLERVDDSNTFSSTTEQSAPGQFTFLGMTIPPGIAFLVPRLPFLLVPPVVVYIVDRLLKANIEVALPHWALLSAYVLCWPIAIVGHAQWIQIQVSRKAAAAGAVLVPLVGSKDPLGVDILRQGVKDWATHYNGVYLRLAVLCT